MRSADIRFLSVISNFNDQLGCRISKITKYIYMKISLNFSSLVYSRSEYLLCDKQVILQAA